MCIIFIFWLAYPHPHFWVWDGVLYLLWSIQTFNITFFVWNIHPQKVWCSDDMLSWKLSTRWNTIYEKKIVEKIPQFYLLGGRGWENFFPSQILPLPTGRYIMFSDITSFVIQNFMTSSVICLKVLVLCSAWIEDELCSVCWSIALLMQFLCSVLNQISV